MIFMRTLSDFKSLAATFGENTEVFVEMPDGELYEVFGFQPTDKHGALMIKLSPRPHNYRKNYMED